MFEKLVVSTVQRRKHTTAKFFLGTSAFYAFALGCAFLVSILVSDPRLADTGSILTRVARLPPAIGGSPTKGPESKGPPHNEVHPDPRHVMDLDTLMSHRSTAPPQIPIIDRGPAGPSSLPFDGPPGAGVGVGIPGGAGIVEPPPKPDMPKPTPAARTTAADKRPLPVTSVVLQGKAIERRKPTYPPLARQIKLQGDVSVEVIISPGGRVESARVVSGHPMFAQYAREAALGWTFEPTLLNGVPVRVTGVITFVFKLGE